MTDGWPIIAALLQKQLLASEADFALTGARYRGPNRLIALARSLPYAAKPKRFTGRVGMHAFSVPDEVINNVASEIHSKTNRDYKIPVLGVPENLETPQVFEILPFDRIDASPARFYAVDGSSNSHTFYNGISLCFYQAGYVAFQRGQQLRLNDTDDPLVLGRLFRGTKMLVLHERDLSDIYDEFLSLSVVEGSRETH